MKSCNYQICNRPHNFRTILLPFLLRNLRGEKEDTHSTVIVLINELLLNKMHVPVYIEQTSYSDRLQWSFLSSIFY